MITILTRIFIHNWPRKCLSLILGIIIWFVVDQSMTTTKTITGIGVKVINIPPGKTVEGILPNGRLNKRITLNITGNKTVLEELSSNDFEVVIDASNQRHEWVANITKSNLYSLDSNINLSQKISKISHKSFIIKLTKLVTEKIPIFVTQPIGEAPKGYQYIDIWPYRLYITISGPEEVIKKLKSQGQKLTFNLNDISKGQLEDLRIHSMQENKDAVSFFVPNKWKQIYLPDLSSTPIDINDPDAKYLKIDFLRSDMIAIENKIPVNLFFPSQFNPLINPQKATLATNDIVQVNHGIKMISMPLYAKGVSELFLEIVRDMLEITVIVAPKTESNVLSWAVQFVGAQALETRYVRTLMSDSSEIEIRDLQPQLREDYLRARFRNYMNRFRFFTQEGKKFAINLDQQGNSITLTEKNSDSQ